MKKKPKQIDEKTNIDLDELKFIVEEECKNQTITEPIRKIIAVIQKIDGKKIWILNCMLGGMEFLKVHVDDENKDVLYFEKMNLMDLVKKV